MSEEEAIKRAECHEAVITHLEIEAGNNWEMLVLNYQYQYHCAEAQRFRRWAAIQHSLSFKERLANARAKRTQRTSDYPIVWEVSNG